PLPTPPDTYPLSLHDALPILARVGRSEVHRRAAALAVEGARRQIEKLRVDFRRDVELVAGADAGHVEIEGAGLGEHGEIGDADRSEEHTSELQSRFDLVCRLL